LKKIAKKFAHKKNTITFANSVRKNSHTMGVLERRVREKENVRANILTVALRLVKEDGWQSLSIRKIAEAIEYSVPVVYDHFENKEAILFEISLEGFRLMEKSLEKAMKKSDNPCEQLKSLADAYWNFAFRNPEYYQLMYGVGMPCCGAGKMKCEITTFQRFSSDAINGIIKKNKSSATDACFKVHSLWSVLHGLISIMMMRNSDIDENMNKKVLDDTIAGFIKNL